MVFFKGTFKNNKYWSGNGNIYIDNEILIGDFINGILNSNLNGNCKIKYSDGIFDNNGYDGKFISNNGETLNYKFRRTW